MSQNGLAPLPSPQQTSRTGNRPELVAKYLQAFPVLANWPTEEIWKHRERLNMAIWHIHGNCANFTPRTREDLEHPLLVPGPVPGEFVETVCTKGRQAEIRDRIREANLPQRFLRLRLAELDESEARTKALVYAENFKQLSREGKGLLVAGPTGTGKTQLVVSLAVDLIERHIFSPVRPKFTTCFKLLELHKDAMRDEAAQHELNLILSSQLVIVDDVGAHRLSDFDFAVLNAFVDQRYAEMRPVVLTTNLSKADLKECIGERSVSRLSEMCETIVLTGGDRRANGTTASQGNMP